MDELMPAKAACAMGSPKGCALCFKDSIGNQLLNT